MFVLLMLAINIVPFCRIIDWESPILPVPKGSVNFADQVLVAGLYMYPMFVSVAVAGFVFELLVLYSPPITTTRPSGSTADAKYVGWPFDRMITRSLSSPKVVDRNQSAPSSS